MDSTHHLQDRIRLPFRAEARAGMKTAEASAFADTQIVRTSDQELSPIENAINSISDKLATFNAGTLIFSHVKYLIFLELNSQRPRLKILQRDLQGTLLHRMLPD